MGDRAPEERHVSRKRHLLECWPVNYFNDITNISRCRDNPWNVVVGQHGACSTFAVVVFSRADLLGAVAIAAYGPSYSGKLYALGIPIRAQVLVRRSLSGGVAVLWRARLLRFGTVRAASGLIRPRS